ncbi:MAG: hypothetical protein JWN21_2296, partial [Sphingomonas bacterium]|nr:hypothetical protein [Sphingomonas bacterium]
GSRNAGGQAGARRGAAATSGGGIPVRPVPANAPQRVQAPQPDAARSGGSR